MFASPLYFWTVCSHIKAFIESFYCIAEEDQNPINSYYQFAFVNYIGFKDRGMVLAGGCGDTNGRPQIDKTEHLQEAYELGKCIYEE